MFSCSLVIAGCTQDTPDSTAFAKDAGSNDVVAQDVLPDSGANDAALGDTDPADATPADAGPVDTGPTDAGPVDAGPMDSGPVDSGPADSGPVDSGPADTGPTDTGPTDTGPMDTGPKDTSGCNAPSDCDDGKICTIDLCNPSDHTCSHKPHTGACDDGDPCTSNDACSGGSCKGGPATLVRRTIALKGPVGRSVSTIAGGLVALAGRTDNKAVVMGFDATHKVAWTTPISPTLEGGMHAIVPAPVTGYVAGGWRKSTGTTGTDGYIAHVGQTGALQKSGKIVGTELHTEVRALLKKSNSVMYFAGSCHDGKNEKRAIYGTFDLTQGKTTANPTYLGGGIERRGANALVGRGKTNVLVGWSVQGTAAKRGWLYGLDANSGFTMFKISHGSSTSPEEFNAAAATSDGGLLVAGSSWGTASGMSDVWLLRTDKVGKKLWARTLGSDATDNALGILATSDGGALLVGQGTKKSLTNALGTVWQVDAWGNLLWQRTANLTGGERLNSVVAGSGALVVSGTNQAASGSSFVLMRMDNFGHSSCGTSGLCAAKKLSDCDDGKVCTADDCDAGKGCIHQPLVKTAVCGVTSGTSKKCNGAGVCP